MRLMMWKQGGKHIHAHGSHGKQNPIDTTSDRLIFYDAGGSVVYDTQTDTWYRDGKSYIPNYPVTFDLDDGRQLIANRHGKGGVTWLQQ